MSHLSLETLNHYLDNELDGAERAAAETHMATCGQCQRQLAALQELFLALETLPPAPLPRDMTAGVLARIAPPPAPARWTWRAWVALAVQLAAALILAFTLASPAVQSLFAVGNGVSFDGLLATFNGLWLRADSWLVSAQTVTSTWMNQATSVAPGPLAALAPLQWALLLAVTGLLWLVGTGLLLTPQRGTMNAER
ncbi:MAG: zf-HC2 domain-containing protein [Chloroflexaceae bacterium]|jgi:anti-sigma factor RsiW|nr:zf-HC2 domain-containing protein [Chloroflexaceae bacterium]